MARWTFALLVALAPVAVAPVLGAQEAGASDATPVLPRVVQREIIARWNGENALRATGELDIAEGRTVDGNVAVARGPLIIAGHVTGSVLAIDADVLLRPTARIDGDLLVVGGDVEGLGTAQLRGAARLYRESFHYQLSGERIVALDSGSTMEDWWRRVEQRSSGSWANPLRVVQAGPYNRVEGLPIQLGPALFHSTSWGGAGLDAAAIFRTGSYNSQHGDLGDNVRGELRFGSDTGRGIGIGARAFSVVDPVEDWQLSNLEVALASFVARRDYRDYYQRHGGYGFITLYGVPELNVTGSFGEERWSSRDLRDPFTLFNDNRPWRPNPLVDEGLFHIAHVHATYDTRTDPFNPWSGWYADADVEAGTGDITSLAPSSDPQHAAGHDSYRRGFFDLRRYNRVSPEAQLNFRLVLGGSLGGDELPLERRLSVDGPGALPGFDFRSPRAGLDVGTCNSSVIPGRPADCDRIALGEVEFRGDIRFDFMRGWKDWPWHYYTAHGDATWVLFADGGRGWRVGPQDGGMTYSSTTFPPLGTFRTDLGAGVDFNGIGIYLAKSTSTPAEPVNFFVRLRHRF